MNRDPESLLGSDDAAAYRRFLDWSVGDGFDLAIVKMTAPVHRNALVAWTKERVPRAYEIDLAQVGPGQSRLWDLLTAALNDHGATMLIFYGLEEAASRQRIIAQLNVERDELVKTFAVPWILFVHPVVYLELMQKAPDFVDFAGLWLDELPAEKAPALTVELQAPHLESPMHKSQGSAVEMDLLTEAADAIRSSRLDEARDLLARYDIAAPKLPAENSSIILARCLRAFVDNQHDEALHILREKLLPTFAQLDERQTITMGYLVEILFIRGEWDEALRLAKDYVIPMHERLGNVATRANMLGRVADILQARGECDEALRISRAEQLPVYQGLGDVREQAITLSRIADIVFGRGEIDEALRLYQKEVLPIFERLDDARERAITLEKVACILEARGELDEALRIRQEEVLPVFERLGDVRSRAITLGRVADIFQARGEFDKALRIRREEELPVYDQLGDVRSRAVTLGRIAAIMNARGQLEQALHLRREEEIPVYERLGDARELSIGRANIALILLRRGKPEDMPEILRLLGLALADARRLRLPEAQQIEKIVRDIGHDPDSLPT